MPSPGLGVVVSGMQMPGEVGTSGPSQKWKLAPVGSVGGAGSQFAPPAPFPRGTMQTGDGKRVTVTLLTLALRLALLLQTLMPGPPGAAQSASVWHGCPVVPSAAPFAGLDPSSPPSPMITSTGLWDMSPPASLDEPLLLPHATPSRRLPRPAKNKLRGLL